MRRGAKSARHDGPILFDSGEIAGIVEPRRPADAQHECVLDLRGTKERPRSSKEGLGFCETVDAPHRWSGSRIVDDDCEGDDT